MHDQYEHALKQEIFPKEFINSYRIVIEINKNIHCPEWFFHWNHLYGEDPKESGVKSFLKIDMILLQNRNSSNGIYFNDIWLFNSKIIWDLPYNPKNSQKT